MILRAGLFCLVLISLGGCGGAFADRFTGGVEAARLSTTAPRPAAFDRWIDGFRPRALDQGIEPRVFDRAFAGIGYNEDSLRLDSHQPEFTRPIWAYLDSAVSDTRIENGQEMLDEHARLLDRIEAEYGVEREVVVAIWGLESSYGQLRGTTPIIETLATLAYEGRRTAFFEEQLIAALRILQAGDVTARDMEGSWAGAMGHTQFIPTSYLAYAVDFDGDGRRDIWDDDPSDALASAAAYLARFGWTRGQPPLAEVRLPRDFDTARAGQRRPLAEWRALGVQAQAGQALPAEGDATLIFPAGAQGPALLTFDNFRVIKRYNNADAYAIAIAHLADRLRGGAAFVADWPRDDRPLTADEREELQRVLARSGHYGGEIDGRVGSGTLAAVRDWQAANGMAPDGYVSLALLERMRAR
ncbi:MAG: membrane-bound lytic murein transglycosylase MltB [Rhodobacteraceae bacterium HLUCCA12]|nr:MAG: membrane-bound lytic murein transglycosylase MltB [Rhodobacteraceae bacterium HLUCCA12]